MKLRQKLTLSAAALSLLTVAAALFGIYELRQSIDVYAGVIASNDAQERAAAKTLVAFKVQVQEWKDTLLRGKDPKQLDKYWNGFQEQERIVGETSQKLKEQLPPGEALSLVERFAQAHAAMGQSYRKGFEAFKAANFDSTTGDIAVKGIDREPAQLLNEAGARIEASTQAAVAHATEKAHQATVISLGLMFAACVLGVVGGVLLARSIVRPIEAAVRVAETVAAGDLTSRIEATGNDEIGLLLAALRRMNDSLVDIVGQVRHASDSIATGSTQIATGNLDLSQRTEEQAANLEQTAASMEELTATVKQNADTARQATQMASSASVVAAEGGNVVERVITTMGDISGSSKKIEEIIGVIDGIAFQTNILALNAAVEAARAGEQGRGFAVVAGEVRSLAQRSAQAAREIKSLIGASVEKVESGSRLVNDAGRTMGEIVTQVQRVTDLIAEISSSSSEQSNGIGQIGAAVQQLDQVTQQNAALVEESAAAAESLKQQAGRLAQTVSLFKLNAA